MPDGFPLEGMELTHILVSADTARARDFYVDVLGAELCREYGSSIVLLFLGNWFLLVEGGPPTEDKPTVTFAPALGPRHRQPFLHHPRSRLPSGLRNPALPRRPLPHPARGLGRRNALLPSRSGRSPFRAEPGEIAGHGRLAWYHIRHG